ncbi:MAG: DUF1952 domain-containing protein [Anaerolineales bacterium]
MTDGASFYTRQIRGIPLWLLQEYLLELGGSLKEEGIVQGEGWLAKIYPMQAFQIGSLSVGQVLLEIEASPLVLETIQPELEKKFLRAGG